MRALPLTALAIGSFALSSCLASTALDIATAPVRVAGKAIDLATTSQSEADEKRGREMRKREERLGQLQRQRDKLQRDCIRGDARSCDRAAQIEGEIQLLMPQVPYEPLRR